MIQLVNAQAMAQAHPETFSAPNKEELSKVVVGDCVKICIDNKERLWVEVTEIKGGGVLKGRIDNVPVLVEGISFGDSLLFKEENIYDIFN